MNTLKPEFLLWPAKYFHNTLEYVWSIFPSLPNLEMIILQTQTETHTFLQQSEKCAWIFLRTERSFVVVVLCVCLYKEWVFKNNAHIIIPYKLCKDIIHEYGVCNIYSSCILWIIAAFKSLLCIEIQNIRQFLFSHRYKINSLMDEDSLKVHGIKYLLHIQTFD